LNTEEADDEESSNKSYNLNHHKGKRVKNRDVLIESIDSDIILQSSLPNKPDGEYRFKIICPTFDKNSTFSDYLSAFKQFKKFLYRSECEINQVNAKYLIAFAKSFDVDSLTATLTSYFLQSINENLDNLLEIIHTLEIAHYYELESVKGECIKVLLEKRNSIEKLNYALWKTISKKYPELVFDIFYSKA